MKRQWTDPVVFAQAALRIGREVMPPFEATGPPDWVVGGKHIGLENLYRMVQYAPGRAEEVIRNYLVRLVEGDAIASTATPWIVAKTIILPRIQPISIFEKLDRDCVLHQPFVNECVILYVLDFPHEMVSLTTEQRDRWGVTTEVVDQIARTNLIARNKSLNKFPEVQFVDSAEGGCAAIMAEQDGYDAARILLPDLHENLRGRLGANFHVYLPARDMFLAISDRPADFIARMEKRIRKDYERLPYPISDKAFIATADGIAGTVGEQA
jgi:uncharacterized protein YtpQ (UPF0354 family)